MNIRKYSVRGVAVLTFIVGLSTYLIWSDYLIRHREAGGSDLLRVIVLKPARVSTPYPVAESTLPLLPRYMIEAGTKSQPDLEKALPEPTPEQDVVESDCGTLLVTLDRDRKLTLNTEETGTLSDFAELGGRLRTIFRERIEWQAYAPEMGDRTDLPAIDRIPHEVLIKASRAVTVGEVIELTDKLRETGASPIALQIDYLPD